MGNTYLEKRAERGKQNYTAIMAACRDLGLSFQQFERRGVIRVLARQGVMVEFFPKAGRYSIPSKNHWGRLTDPRELLENLSHA